MVRDQYYCHNHPEEQEQMINQIQGFDETNQNTTDQHQYHYNHQIFGSTSNMGMMMLDFSKQQHIRMTSGQDHNHHQASGGTDQNQLLENSPSSSMRLNNAHHNNFPSEVNVELPPERPSQGLSLSLSSSNPTNISLQSFELRPQQQQQQQQGYSGRSTQHQNLQNSQMMMMMMNSQQQNNSNNHQEFHQIGSSKYLIPTQELLSEFCSLGVKESDEEVMMMKQKREQKGKQQEEWDTSHNNNNNNDQSATTSSKNNKHVPPLHSLEFMELQKRKAKLLSMLEELKRRYGHYREQMRVAAATFETAVGVGAAETYTALASRAMSRHFRCLKDGLVRQIQATSQALGEREEDNHRTVSVAARGETPRLRLLDQALRQQRSYRQMSLADAHPWRPQRGLPERAVTTLRAWLFEHFLHPYPSDVDKHILARQTGLSRSQVSNWFINARVRLWKPMIEEMYCEETRGEQVDITNPMLVDTKPDPNQIIGVEPESLSSIVTSKTGHKHNTSNQGTTSFGSTFDFSLYGHDQAVTYAGEGGTREVSLTLGLQNGGVSLALSPVTAHGGPLYYGRDHMEDCQQGSVQYSSSSMLDGDHHHQAQNLPYRNLMGAQLLHDVV